MEQKTKNKCRGRERPGSARMRGLVAALLAALLVALGAPVAFAVPDSMPSGVSNTTERTLTIWAKDSLAVTMSDAQKGFQADAAVDALGNITEAAIFHITKITPAATDISTVKAGNTSTYTKIADVFVKSDVGQGKAVISFSSPHDLTAATAGKEHVTVQQGTVSATESGTYAAGDSAAATALLDAFIATDTPAAGDKTADGVYIVEAMGGSGWWTVVEVPTYMASGKDSIASDTNYAPVVYAKLKDALKPAFNSYVNIVRSDGTTVASRISDMSKWGTVGVSKGVENYYTAAFTMNGLNAEYDYVDMTNHVNRKMGQIAFGLAYTDAATATVANMAVQNSTAGNAGYDVPYLSLNKTADNGNKIFTLTQPVEVGVIVSKVDDPTSAKYYSVWNGNIGSAKTEMTSGIMTGISFYAGVGTNSGYAVQSTGHCVMRGAGLGTGLDPFVPHTAGTTGSQGNIADAVASAITNCAWYGGTRPASLDQGALSLEWNDTLGYTEASQLFGAQSAIKVELAMTFNLKLTGTAFTAGNTPATNVKPFLYGCTYDRGGPREHDFATFLPAATSGNQAPALASMGEGKVDVYAQVYTGAVNAIKVDQFGAPLAGAKFALMRRDAGANRYAKPETSPATNGFDFSVSAAPTASNVYLLTTDSTGKVTFDGLNPDAVGMYHAVEFAPPDGYKDLPHDTVPGESNFGGAAIDAVTLNWADNAAAASKAPADAGYKAMTKVINVPKLALPNTGGPGLAGLLALGACLLLIGISIRARTRRAAAQAAQAGPAGIAVQGGAREKAAIDPVWAILIGEKEER